MTRLDDLKSESMAIRKDEGALKKALEDAGATFHGRRIKCPFHDDQTPSAGVYRAEDGVCRFKCHGCGFCGDVIAVKAQAAGTDSTSYLRAKSHNGNGQPVAKVFRTAQEITEHLNRTSGGRVAAVYTYTQPDTRKAELLVYRVEIPDGSKTFRQASPSGAGFVQQAPPKPWPIYNRTRLKTADSVVVVEGEKCVHALAEVAVVATTSPGGAGKAAMADWSPLAGKRVILWPDNDSADEKGIRKGDSHMRDVAAQLELLSPRPQVLWLDVSDLDLPPKGDVVEFLSQYGHESAEGRRDAALCAIELAQPMAGASAEVSQLIEDTISRKRMAIAWPWPAIGRLTKALLPGTVTCLCGDPGCGKSFFVLEAVRWWHQNGVKVVLYELEEDRAFHLYRALAQLEENSDLVDDDFVRRCPDESRAAAARHKAALDSFGPCVHAAPDSPPTLDAMAVWVKQQCDRGARIIVIDPITVASTSERPWLDDLRFLMTVKSAVREAGASLLLVTHPRKGKRAKVPDLHDLSGGASYQRFAQTVLWLNRPEKRRTVRIEGVVGMFVSEINRSLRIAKARNGRGAGLELAYQFEGKSLRFSEQGVICKDDVEQLVDASHEPQKADT